MDNTTKSIGSSRHSVSMLYVVGAIGGVLAFALALLLSFGFSIAASQIVQKDSEQLFQQLLDSLKPIAEEAIYSSSKKLGRMAIIPLIHSKRAVQIELYDDSNNVLVRFPESPIANIDAQGLDRIVLPLEDKNSGRAIGRLTTYIDYLPGQNIKNLSLLALAVIVASNLILALVLLFAFWKKLLSPLQRLKADVEKSDQFTNFLSFRSSLSGSPLIEEIPLTSKNIQLVMACFRSNYGSRELSDLAASFMRSLHETLEATMAKEEATAIGNREVLSRLALTQSIKRAISDSGIFISYAPSNPYSKSEDIGAELDDDLRKLSRTLFYDVDKFKQLIADVYPDIAMIEVEGGRTSPQDKKETYSCELRSDAFGVWYLSRFALDEGGRAIVCTDLTVRQMRADEH